MLLEVLWVLPVALCTVLAGRLAWVVMVVLVLFHLGCRFRKGSSRDRNRDHDILLRSGCILLRPRNKWRRGCVLLRCGCRRRRGRGCSKQVFAVGAHWSRGVT